MFLDLLGKTTEPAECTIRMGASAEEISDLYGYLKEVVVESSRTQASIATLTFDSRRDEAGGWEVQDHDQIRTWEPILIDAVFGSTVEEIMSGYVREIRAEYPSDAGTATVVVECQDDSLALDREQVRKVWGAEAPTTDTAIFSEIVTGRHGLVPHSDNASGQTNLVLNQDATDIRFLRARAIANAYELVFSRGKVYFGPPRLEAAAQSTIMVYAGRDTNCLSFTANADAHLPDKVAVDIPDDQGSGNTREIIESDLPLLGPESADSSSSGLDEFVWVLRGTGGADPEELRGQAQQRANRSAMKLKAEGELDGSVYGHVLRVAEPVVVDGIGAKLSGTYYVDSVTHRFDVSGYKQSFKLMRNAYGDNVEAGGLGALGGLF